MASFMHLDIDCMGGHLSGARAIEVVPIVLVIAWVACVPSRSFGNSLSWRTPSLLRTAMHRRCRETGVTEDHEDNCNTPPSRTSSKLTERSDVTLGSAAPLVDRQSLSTVCDIAVTSADPRRRSRRRRGLVFEHGAPTYLRHSSLLI